LQNSLDCGVMTTHTSKAKGTLDISAGSNHFIIIIIIIINNVK